MGDLKCKNCKLYDGDCGHHFKDAFGHINYEIPAEFATDLFGDCIMFKSRGPISSFSENVNDKKYYGHENMILTEDDIKKLNNGKKLYSTVLDEYTISLKLKKE